MEKSNKFLGLCILIGLICLSLSIAYYATCQRFYIKDTDGIVIIDRYTGNASWYNTEAQKIIPIPKQ